MSGTIKSYQWLILSAVMIVLGSVGLVCLYVHQYDKGYDAGIVAQKAAQEKANSDARKNNEAAKTKLERQHAAELASANADARTAADSVRELRRQLAEVGRVTADYSGAVGISAPAGSTAGVLAYVLSESVERNRILAEYADNAALAGRLCERQYDSLTIKPR